ncbi:MAG: isocitrate lyase/phosphoenolpyruvate mutase family protein [Acidimicrobiales bacterium]
MTSEPSITEHFKSLHHSGTPLILPNPWDIGSARVLAALGYKALATTSSGFAQTLGRADGGVTRSEALQHASQMVNATPLPVSADLENGFGDSPEMVAETVSLAVDCGLAGCSIEDYSAEEGSPGIYERNKAIERVAAAVESAHAIDPSFVVTARAENYLHGIHDLDDTLERLRAYEQVGADVLYAPALSSLEDVATVTGGISMPVNVLAWGDFTVESLSEVGVSRISLGGRWARATFACLIQAAQRTLDDGTFDISVDTSPLGNLNSLFNGYSTEDRV